MTTLNLGMDILEPTPDVINTILHGHNNFVNTLDHLPCDITRSLWIIQMLNLKNKRIEEKLINLFKSNGGMTEINGLKLQILKNSNELICESQYLINILNNHSLILIDDLELIKILKLNLKGWTSEAVEKRWKQWGEFKKDYLNSIKNVNNENNPFLNFKIENKEKGRDTSKSLDHRHLKIKISLKPTHIQSSIKSNIPPPKRIKKEVKTGPVLVIKQLNKQQKEKKYEAKLTTPESTPVTPSPKHVTAIQEETYCFCNGPSFGHMVACEYEKCPHEWFHFKCVGLTSEPKNEWFCSDFCRIKYENAKLRKKQKKRKKNW